MCFSVVYFHECCRRGTLYLLCSILCPLCQDPAPLHKRIFLVSRRDRPTMDSWFVNRPSRPRYRRLFMRVYHAEEVNPTDKSKRKNTSYFSIDNRNVFRSIISLRLLYTCRNQDTHIRALLMFKNSYISL